MAMRQGKWKPDSTRKPRARSVPAAFERIRCSTLPHYTLLAMLHAGYVSQVDDVLSRTSAQANLFDPCSWRATASDVPKLEHSLELTRRLLSAAKVSIGRKETALQLQAEKCAYQSKGSQRAWATLESIRSHVSSQGSQSLKVPVTGHESPLDYLNSVARSYEDELRACESTLGNLFLVIHTGEVDLAKQDFTLYSLLSAFEQALSAIHVKLRKAT